MSYSVLGRIFAKMNKKVLTILEYDKIIDMLAAETHSGAAASKARRLTPSSNRDEIISWQAQTSAALDRLLRFDRPSFHGLTDPRAAIRPLEKGGVLGAGELLDICRLLELAADAILIGSKPEERDILSGMFDGLTDIPELRTEIKRCIISPEEIADDASAELKSIRRTIRGMDARIRDQLNKTIASSSDMLRETIVTIRDGRYCLPVRSEFKSSFPGMIHDRSSTGSTFFIEPMEVVNLNNELSTWFAKEQDEISKILKDLSLLLAPHTEVISADFLLLLDLDFIFAKAALSRKMNATEPLFQGKYIQLKSARHPLIDPKKVVPIDLTLGREYDLLVITGPNTGGKTVTLKTVGLLTLMGQSGLHIPARDRSHLRVYREVFADIGDEQSIEQSLSTFSSHMTNTIDILKKADKNTLALFDELGAGTDPGEGAALAIAILNHLHERHITSMATTHYSELKLYALKEDGVENASCEFDVASLKPTYRLIVGIPGKSNAFAISEKLGLDKQIIDDAAGYINSDEKSFEDVVSDLEKSRITAEQEREKAIRFRENAEGYEKKLRSREERLEQSKERILRRANEEAYEIIERAKKVADEAIRKYNKWMDDPEAIKAMERERSSLRDAMNELDKNLDAASERAPSHRSDETHEFAEGDVVMVHSMGAKGVIASAPVKGKCYVRIGILRTEVTLDDLEYLKAETKQAKKEARTTTRTGKLGRSKAMSVHTEINLIGMTTAEAIPVLEKYIDDAYLAHLTQVRIIHGMGTGALRNAVHDHLKRNPSVSDYRLGEAGEGGYGATVATLDYGN